MAPKRTSTSTAPAMNQAAIQKLVADSVAAALEVQAATIANTDNTNRNTEQRETPVAGKCSYKEFISCQPFNFKVPPPIFRKITQLVFGLWHLTFDGFGFDLWAKLVLELWNLEKLSSNVVDATLGDLAGGRYYSGDCVAAVTLGLATNAVYVESSQFVPNGRSKHGEMVIPLFKSQWGNFNTPHLPITQFDMALDSESSNQGCRIFEKLVGGTYLGEVVRRVLLKMAIETALFGETVPAKLKTPYILRSPDMAAMHQDSSENRDTVQEKLIEVFGITNASLAVREIVAEVCDVVAERGARLTGACIIGIMKKRGRINDRKSVVIIEGGLYEHYRVFRNLLHSSVWEMLGSSLADNVIVEPAHGGSGAGAIFVAAAQSQMNKSASASFGAEGKDDERESAIANDDDPVDMAEWKDDDQTDTASWKDGEVDQMEDSTAEISDQSEILSDRE
nr:probable hexokinase-like 2 protein [Tanacetum cinerariifolium]